MIIILSICALKAQINNNRNCSVIVNATQKKYKNGTNDLIKMLKFYDTNCKNIIMSMIFIMNSGIIFDDSTIIITILNTVVFYYFVKSCSFH